MAEAAHAQPAWVLLAYLIAGVCFILALRGLSGPESSRRGNRFGMLGMGIAVVVTLLTHLPWLQPVGEVPSRCVQGALGCSTVYDLNNGLPAVAGGILAAIIIGGSI